MSDHHVIRTHTNLKCKSGICTLIIISFSPYFDEACMQIYSNIIYGDLNVAKSVKPMSSIHLRWKEGTIKQKQNIYNFDDTFKLTVKKIHFCCHHWTID